MNTNPGPVRTRFAPSPTGYLHIGGVRTALFNWLFARQHGGQFLLRIDDTDQQRNVAEALQPILDGFRWLGLDWDEGPEVGGPHAPYFQSARLARYQAAVAELLRRGAAYRDYATTEELAAEREAAEKEKRLFLYSRRWMAETDEDAARFESQGRKAVVRLKMPREGQCQFRDLIRGDVSFEWAAEQDHVVQRADGTCLYHLASAIDDYDFRISHVIRAVEHLSNTPRQIFIMQSLEYPLPEFAHLPYVAEPGSSNKLSKRKIAQYLKHADFKKLQDHALGIAQAIGHSTAAETFNPVIVDFYRVVGYLPDAILNYLLLLGWAYNDSKEDFSREEMIQLFSLERVNKAPASFDPKKLWAFQDRHMRAVPAKQKTPMAIRYLQQAGWVPKPPPCDLGGLVQSILEAAGDRFKTAGDILQFGEFFVADDALTYDDKEFDKQVRPAAASGLLARFRERLAGVSNYDAASLEEMLKSFVADENIKLGQLIHPLRIALTGKTVGIGLYETFVILGQARSLARLDQTLARAV